MAAMLAAKPSRRPSSAPRPIWLALPLISAIVLAARFAWLFNHAGKWDTAPQIPLLILCEVPLVVALAFVASKRKLRLAAHGAGIAFAAALFTALLAIPLAFVVELGYVDIGVPPSVDTLNRWLDVCFLGALWLLVFSFRHGKGRRLPFFSGFAVGAVYLFGAVTLAQALAVPGSGALKEKTRYLEASYSSPEVHLRALMACLIRYRALHPASEFPAALSNVGPAWNCSPDIADPWAVSGYWIDYWPVKDGSDFRVEAVPVRRAGAPMPAGDARGEVFQFFGLAASAAQRRMADAKGRFSVQTIDTGAIPLGALGGVRYGIREYARTHDGAAPSSLTGVIDQSQMPPQHCSGDDLPEKLVVGGNTGWNCYGINYSPPLTSSPASFAVSVECLSYGNGCIRSYLLDHDGTMHATPEPRPATPQDPGLLPCENAIGFNGPACQDPVWTSSERASALTFTHASLLYAVHTTRWW
jgi:hypothetical protein